MAPQFRYAPNYPEGARLSEAPCNFCGKSPTLAAIYLDPTGEPSQFACATCLESGHIVSYVPSYLEDTLHQAVVRSHPDWSAEQVSEWVVRCTRELAHTPPVPWLQSNEWPLCRDDFAQYVGEMTHESLMSRTGSAAAAKETLRDILRQVMPDWVQDERAIEAEWAELGNYLAVFEFRCPFTSEPVYVVQTA